MAFSSSRSNSLQCIDNKCTGQTRWITSDDDVFVDADDGAPQQRLEKGSAAAATWLDAHNCVVEMLRTSVDGGGDGNATNGGNPPFAPPTLQEYVKRIFVDITSSSSKAGALDDTLNQEDFWWCFTALGFAISDRDIARLQRQMEGFDHTASVRVDRFVEMAVELLHDVFFAIIVIMFCAAVMILVAVAAQLI